MSPEDLQYTKDHEWVRTEGETVRVGVTDYAQDALGDIVFVTLPEAGTHVTAGETCGEVESTKSVSDVFAPVTGTVVERNEALDAAPELVNSDPYGDGWMLAIRPDDASSTDAACSTPRPTRPSWAADRSFATAPTGDLEPRAVGSRSATHQMTSTSAASPWRGGTQMPFCTQCGHSNTEDARFCSNCGAALSAGAVLGRLAERDLDDHHQRWGFEPGELAEKGEGLSGADQAAIDALPPGSALLVVRRGPNSGSRFLLDSDTTTAGRHPSSDIFLDDVTVSRRHAEFVRADGRASASATWARSTAPTSTGTASTRPPLAGGDEVQVGKYRLVYYPSQHGSSGGDERRSAFPPGR